MQLPTVLQGRPFGPEELAQVQALGGQQADWSRYRLSRELARRWDWRTPQGQLKDMAARTLLLKLQEQGWIELPPARMKSPTRSGRAPASDGPALDQSPVVCALEEVVPLRLHEVSQVPALRVAMYSWLLLAGWEGYGPARAEVYEPLPKWRRGAKRPSCLDRVTLLRKQLAEKPTKFATGSVPPTYETMVGAAAA